MIKTVIVPAQETLAATLTKDLEHVLATALSLRSIQEVDAERWLKGEDTLYRRAPHPHPTHVSYIEESRQPHDRPYLLREEEKLTKNYDVRAPSGETYTFLVEYNAARGPQDNHITLRYRKTHPCGPNSSIGTEEKYDKNVLYTLPWIAQVPLGHISFDAVTDFFRDNNGFSCTVRRPKERIFFDLYPSTQAKTNLPVYVIIEPAEHGNAVRITQDILLPHKKL